MTLRPLLLVCAAAAAFAQPPGQPAQARIKIDTDRVIGVVHPYLFGNFAEHLGRCIYGGMYEEGGKLSDSDGYRKDVMQAVRDLGVSVLRWPGGNFASGYNWKDGIGPQDLRPVRSEQAWGALESNRFGTDEFLRYCEKAGLTPYICINAGLGSIEDARQWVEYTNESRHTYWADQRRKNGRDAPWNVKIWGLGNEIDGPWQLGHKNAEDYAKFALEAAKVMRLADSSIQLIASGSSYFGPNVDWIGWNRTVLEKLGGEIDYIALHTYIGNRDNDFERFLSASQDLDQRIEIVAGLIREAQSSRPRPRPIYIAYDEWNVEAEFHTYENALAMGMFFNSFFRHADVVKMANLAQLVNVIAPIYTNKDGLFLQPIYFPIAEYGKQRGNLALDALVTSPQYKVAGHTLPLNQLDASVTYNKDRGEIYVNVLNRSKSDDIAARIQNVETGLDGSVEVWEMNHSDFKATHTFGDDKKLRPVTRVLKVQSADPNSLDYTFPAHSLTILKLRTRS
jgi:alpha-N-arabinofuranosidase